MCSHLKEVKPDPSKVEAILKMERPKDVAAVRRLVPQWTICPSFYSSFQSYVNLSDDWLIKTLSGDGQKSKKNHLKELSMSSPQLQSWDTLIPPFVSKAKVTPLPVDMLKIDFMWWDPPQWFGTTSKAQLLCLYVIASFVCRILVIISVYFYLSECPNL